MKCQICDEEITEDNKSEDTTLRCSDCYAEFGYFGWADRNY